jgi:hypothetical protein
VLVLDSGGVSFLAQRSKRSLAMLRAFRDDDLWPPVVPTVILVETLRGRPGPDANTNRFLKTCIIDDHVPTTLARRAAQLRHRARRGSAVDALVVALAEPHGTVLTGDADDLGALAAHADDVVVETL